MFNTLNSAWGKTAGLVMLAAGLVVGLALTGNLSIVRLVSSMGGDPGATATVAGTVQGIPLAFPETVLEPAPVAPEPTETAVIQQGPVEISYQVPVAAPVRVAPPVVPPAPPCVSELTSVVNGLMGAVAGMVSSDQANVVLEQLNGVGAAANACAQQIALLGSQGTEQIAQVGRQLTGLVSSIQALPLLPPAPQVEPSPAGETTVINPVETGLEVVGLGLEKTLEFVGGVLNFALSPIQPER